MSAIYSNLASWSTIADAFLCQPATDVRYGWRFGNSNLRLTTLNHDGRISNLFGSGAQNISLGYSNVENIFSDASPASHGRGIQVHRDGEFLTSRGLVASVSS